MSKKIIDIRKNSYSDSVTLMSLSAEIKKRDDITEAVVSMATAMNKELLERVGLSDDSVQECTENDLVIAFECSDDTAEADIIALVDELLKGSTSKSSGQSITYHTINEAKENTADADMVIISVPGEHAAREAMNALRLGMNVMLFSDNVTIEEELALKKYAHEKELLVMGPDCGTAYINGTALCFANKVRRGKIGIAGASGTGMQELMVLIDRLGGGISNAIGTGGRDLTEEIGGIMITDGLRMLQADSSTEVIVVVSKLPAASVREKLMQLVDDEISKPVIIYFTTDETYDCAHGAVPAASLKDAAAKAVAALNGMDCSYTDELPAAKSDSPRYIRGLYCGGTLCAEAYYYIRNRYADTHSNVSKKAGEKLTDVFVSEGHTLLDLGDDVFTNGRPHPMIDPTIRLDRILQESRDPKTGVIILDFELGYGSHEDPVGATIDTIKIAMENASEDGRDLKFVTYVCGTDTDVQDRKSQEKLLRDAGCIVADSNIDAVYEACRLV